ncbi:hypothetical protein D047_2799A, partial [Vibrio parahaemolyticus VPTS-2010_2]
MHRAPAW